MGEQINSHRAVIIGGNISTIDGSFINALSDNELLICADKGYEYALSNNLKPHIVVGDFDSSPLPDRCDINTIVLPAEKDDTDLLYAVKLALTKGIKKFLLVGVTGGRADHTIATYFTMNYILKHGAEATVKDKEQTVYLTNKLQVIKRPDFKAYFSVFPFGGNAYGVTVKGGKYSLNDDALTCDFPIGVSNEFVDDEVEISVKDGALLIIVTKKD